eukprot:2825208-Heterocapsa_arctica.AAC.1
MPNAVLAKGQEPTVAPSWAGAWRSASARAPVAQSGRGLPCTVRRGHPPTASARSTALGSD